MGLEAGTTRSSFSAIIPAKLTTNLLVESGSVHRVAPDRALAYKIGQLEIRDLRRKGRAKNWASVFDVRKFHDAILGSGALPLDLLEKQMDEWLAVQH